MGHWASVHERGIVFGSVVVGQRPVVANPEVMSSTGNAWNDRFWQIVTGVIAATIAGVLVYEITLGHHFWVVPAFAVPVWLVAAVGVAVAVAAFAVIRTTVSRHVLSNPPRSETSFAEPIDPTHIEIDLRSIAAVTVLFSTNLPQILVFLRIINHTPYRITVTHLTASVWFSQPTVDLAIKTPFSVDAHTTRDDVYLGNILEDSATDAIRAFFARDDSGKAIMLDVSVSGQSDGGNFTTGAHFDLRGHDIKGVQR
jgi:hypothetical protein